MALKPEILSSFSGGINLTGAPLNIGENDLLGCQNMYPVASGYLIGRGGQTNYTPSAIDANPIKSLYRFYKQNGQGITLATSGAAVYRMNDSTGAATLILGGQSLGQRVSFTSWSTKDKVYWQNNAGSMQSYDGTTVSALGAAPVGSQIEMYLDRLYVLQPNQVAFSDLARDDVWQGAALLNIGDNKGGTAQFIKAANQMLIVGKSSGLWRLQGSPLLGNVFRQYSDVGCVAPWSADVVTVVSNGQVIPAGVIFCGKDGIYITDGNTTTLVSNKITPIFTGYFRGAVGKYYPKLRQYWFSFDTSGGANDTLWVGTNIDMAGSQIAWSEYTGFNLDSFTVFDGINDSGELLAGLSTNGIIRRLDSGIQDAGVDYTCSLTTRYFGAPFNNQQVRWIKPVFDATKTVHYQIDYFQKQLSAGNMTVDAPAGIWDVGTWDIGTWGGTSFNSARTSVLDYKYGRYYSTKIFNTGDGSRFKFFSLAIESRSKDRRFHDVFTLNTSP